MKIDFSERLHQLQMQQEQLLQQKNAASDQYNGIYQRYKNPVLTAAHAPLNWRYDLNKKSNPFLMERFG
ncbi:MAG: glycosidase, partial [Sphingobacteriaceae bacterium]